jgi:hypothetical protein
MNTPATYSPATIIAILLLCGLGGLSCATSTRKNTWTDFPPTTVNFQQYLAERGDLDPIEGIWALGRLGPGDVAVVRDSSYRHYEFIGVYIGEPGYQPPSARGAVFIAFAGTESDSLYEYRDGGALSGAQCYVPPCQGKVVLRGRVLRFPDRHVIHDTGSLPPLEWAKRYPFR